MQLYIRTCILGMTVLLFCNVNHRNLLTNLREKNNRVSSLNQIASFEQQICQYGRKINTLTKMFMAEKLTY